MQLTFVLPSTTGADLDRRGGGGVFQGDNIITC